MISVIIPVYNAEKFLKRCIDSILHQKFQDYEIILINDGSTDASRDICTAYAQAHDNISFIDKPNEGVSSARNCGIKQAKGEYIAFVDSDDYVSPDYLSNLINANQAYEVDLVQGGFRKVNAESHDIEIVKCVESEQVFFSKGLYFKFLRGFVISKLFKKEIIQKHNIHFDTRITLAEDLCFVLEYCRYVKGIVFIPTADYFYYINEGSASYRFHKPDARYAQWKLKAEQLSYLQPDKDETDEYYMNWITGTANNILQWLVAASIVSLKGHGEPNIKNILISHYGEYSGILKSSKLKSRIKRHIVKNIVNRRFRYVSTLLYIISIKECLLNKAHHH